MKKKLNEKDLSQIVKKVLNEIETLEPFYAKERKRYNTYKIYESLAELQSLIRDRNFDKENISELISIFKSEISYLETII